MEEIKKSAGLNPSENELITLCQKTFLGIWNTPNVFYAHGVGTKGKEFCDVLVACGQTIIVFSDKKAKIEFDEESSDKDVLIRWDRWYRRAIEESVVQLNGAHRLLSLASTKLYLDQKCSKPLPYSLPEFSTAKIHLVAVARGSQEAASKFWANSTSSIMLNGGTKSNSGSSFPFNVGNVNPEGPFVHVFDDVTIKLMFEEFDTITDFANYLDKKEKLFQEFPFLNVDGEESLIVNYAKSMDDNNEHNFSFIKEAKEQSISGISIFNDVDLLEDFRKHPQYIAKKKADKSSYFVDGLIEHFTEFLHKGTLINEGPSDYNTIEFALRRFALMKRYERRGLADAFFDLAMKKDFLRVRYVHHRDSKADVITLLGLRRPKGASDEEYRKKRSYLLKMKALKFLRDNAETKIIYGLGFEPYPADSTFDLTFARKEDLTSEVLEEIDFYVENFEKRVYEDGAAKIIYRGYTSSEYPEPEPMRDKKAARSKRNAEKHVKDLLRQKRK